MGGEKVVQNTALCPALVASSMSLAHIQGHTHVWEAEATHAAPAGSTMLSLVLLCIWVLVMGTDLTDLGVSHHTKHVLYS